MADTVVDHAADRADEDGGPCAHKEHRHGLCTGHEAGPAIAQGGQQLCAEAGAGGGQGLHLVYNPRYASSVVEKLLKSAIANAENNNGMKAENLYVAECYANKGPTMKRIHPRAQGRAYRIEKRMSHITIVLDER